MGGKLVGNPPPTGYWNPGGRGIDMIFAEAAGITVAQDVASNLGRSSSRGAWLIGGRPNQWYLLKYHPLRYNRAVLPYYIGPLLRGAM